MQIRWKFSVLVLSFFISISCLFTIACQKDKPSNQQFVSNSVGMKFVYISPGSFIMGSPSGEPERHPDEARHQVSLSKGFYLGMTEVTHRQWNDVMGNNPSAFNECGEDCPVESVSWHEVQKFIRKLNDMEEKSVYRLPTEAEWEYACRAGTETLFSYGNCLSTDQANFDGRRTLHACSNGKYRESPLPVATFPANSWGLYDMHGNVWEWCLDWYGKKLSGDVADPTGASAGKYKVIRGGSWFSVDHDCRSANRDRSSPHLELDHTGFRVLMIKD
jgi:formylglycine-generating enzyme required for sulfatase activity